MDSRLKVYCPPNKFDNIFSDYHANGEIFEFERDFFKLESDISKCDIVPVFFATYQFTDSYLQKTIDEKIQNLIALGVTKQKLLLANIFHLDIGVNDVYSYPKIIEKFNTVFPNQSVIVHTNRAYKNHIYYDYLWNRQKAYMTDFNRFDLWDRLYTRSADILVYGLRKIKKVRDEKNEPQLKKFLCPNRIYYDQNGKMIDHPRLVYREKLKQLITSEDFKNTTYSNDPKNGQILPTTNKLVNDYLKTGNGGCWYPIDNQIYENSFISVYIETITSRYLGNNSHPNQTEYEYSSITEKTWDPLIKGHFILPFGYQHMIRDIQDYGFKLPDWIDYSYDNIKDDDERFSKFINTLVEINKMPIQLLEKHFENNYELLEFNRGKFWSKPYDSLYHKIKQYFNL